MTAQSEIYREALTWFHDLVDAACKTDLSEPMAMSLATVDAEGRPSVRTMLLKDVDERGFIFFTNSRSRKGKELLANPHGALCFFWQPLMRQVRVEGRVEQIGDADSQGYWESRPRDSQLCAWASRQSEPLDERKRLEQAVAKTRSRFMDKPVPRPGYWSGYRLAPERIEFWKSGWHRVHERILYENTRQGWRKILLYP